MDAATFAKGLREFADWIEANKDHVEWELECADEDPPFRFNLYATTKEAFGDYVRALGRGAKEVDDSWFHVVRTFGPVRLDVFAARATVCERVVTGTREVTKTVRDPLALEQVPLIEVTEVVEDVEWICEPSILGATDEAVA